MTTPNVTFRTARFPTGTGASSIFSRGRALLVLLPALFLLFLTACDQTSTQIVDSTAEQGELRVTPNEIVLDNGATYQLEVRRVYPDGRTGPSSGPVNWRSSSPAVDSVTSSGLVTARLPGEVTITAETSRGTATAKVEILPTNEDLRLEVSEFIEVEADEDAEASLSARIVDVTGRPIPGVQVDFFVGQFAGAPESIREITGTDGFARTAVPVGTQAGEQEVEVTSPGLPDGGIALSTVAESGEAQVSANNRNLRAAIRVAVRPAHAEEVHLSPESATLDVGGTLTYTVVVIDKFGNELEDPPLTWSSSRANVVEVSSDGVARASAGGVSEITATNTHGSGRSASGSATIQVRTGDSPTPGGFAKVSGDGQSGTVGTALPSPLSVRVTDGSGNGVPNVTVSWRVQGGEAQLSRNTSTTDSGGVASVSVTLGQTAGAVRVAADASSLPTQSFDLTAEPGAAASVSLSPGSMELDAGETHRFTATVRDEYGNDISSPDLDWTSSDTQIAIVNNDGRVTARESGSAAIRARTEGRTGTAMVEVQSENGDEDPSDPTPDPASLHISAPSTSLTALGQEVQFAVSAQNADGEDAELPSSISWSSSNSNVATVNASGRVIAHAVGTAVIGVAAACCTGDQISIQVTQQVANVQVSPGSASLTPGTTRQFSAEVRDANGHAISGASVSWSSTNTSVASVSSSGVVVANSTGSASIRATSSGQVGQASVSVSSGNESGSSPFPNEPAGYVTLLDDGFDYPGVTLNDPWFDVQGAGFGGRFNHGGRPSISRQNNGQPFSGPSAYRAFYPGGMPGGHDAARLSLPLSGQAHGGFYLAYSVRLDQSWHTRANETGNGIKHVIPWVVPSDGSDARPLGWTTIAQNPSGDNRYRVNYTLENIPPETFRRHDIPFVNEQAALINKGDWAQVELLVQFDQAGRGTGSIRFYVNGTLVSRMDNAPIPVDRLRNLTIAGTYGGGIGDVPHDMWYDVGHIYVSGPAN